MRLTEDHIKDEIKEMFNIVDREPDWYDVLTLLNTVESQKDEIEKLRSQKDDLISGIYENVDELSSLFDLAERLDKK